MRHPPVILLLVVTLSGHVHGQEQPSITVYPALYAVSYLRPSPDSTTSPKLIGTLPITVGRFYGEVRYNYDADNTVGVYGGHTVSFGNRLPQSLSGQLGVLLGAYQGISTQLYYQLSTPGLEINSQQQYSVSWQTDNHPFYYTWSDVQWKIGRHLRAGLSVQVYRTKGDGYTDGGLLIGYKLPRISLGLYHFNVYQPGQGYALFALQYELSFSRSGRPGPDQRAHPAPLPTPFTKPAR